MSLTPLTLLDQLFCILHHYGLVVTPSESLLSNRLGPFVAFTITFMDVFEDSFAFIFRNTTQPWLGCRSFV